MIHMKEEVTMNFVYRFKSLLKKLKMPFQLVRSDHFACNLSTLIHRLNWLKTARYNA